MFRRRLLTVWAVILCLGVLVGAGYGQTLKEAVNASEPEVRTFSLTGNETVTDLILLLHRMKKPKFPEYLWKTKP